VTAIKSQNKHSKVNLHGVFSWLVNICPPLTKSVGQVKKSARFAHFQNCTAAPWMLVCFPGCISARSHACESVLSTSTASLPFNWLRLLNRALIFNRADFLIEQSFKMFFTYALLRETSLALMKHFFFIFYANVIATGLPDWNSGLRPNQTHFKAKRRRLWPNFKHTENSRRSVFDIEKHPNFFYFCGAQKTYRTLALN